MRNLVISDIHGNLIAFKQALERSGYNPKNDNLFFLGDYVDAWPQSKQLIDFLIELNSNGNCVFIRGNHDVWWENWLKEPMLKPYIWTSQGGESTIRSYGGQLPPDSHLEFSSLLKDYFIDDKDNVFVHGGFRGNIEDNKPSDLHWNREMAQYVWFNRRNPKEYKYHNHKGLVFIGHTQTTAYDASWTTPINKGGIVMMDTGAGYLRGKLTIMNIDNPEEYWQSNVNTSNWPYFNYYE